jgi:hypothetical protein
MVVLQRNEVKRNHVVSVLGVILAITVLSGVLLTYSGRSAGMQVVLILLSAAAVAALILAALQLVTSPKRSQALIFYRDEGMVVAVNTLHEGFKLRYLRDILGENCSSFSDEERLRWKDLEADGFYASLSIRNARRLVVLRLCTMIFDDVFVADQFGRWEYFDASCTSEPSFSKREMPPLKRGKGMPLEQG